MYTTWTFVPDLVGDGTSDSHPYLGRYNANHIADYFAEKRL